MDPAYLALLAVKLAILTFYIGVLIYALPVPLATLKRWGPQLLWDGLLSLLLAALYATLYTLSSRIALLLGGSWTLFNVWSASSLGVAISLKTLLAAVTAIPEVSRLAGVLYAVAVPLDRAATLAILFLTTIAGVAELVYNYGLVLIALGAVLYAIPLRLARGAGAWLIAFVIVFNIGLQTLPIFVSSFARAPEVPGATVDYRLLTVKVEGANGHPAAYGFLRIERNGELLALYKLDGGGVAVSQYLEGGRVAVPAMEVHAYLEYVGVLFPLVPDPLRLQDYANGQVITLRAPHLVVAKSPLILAYSSKPWLTVEDGGSWFRIKAPLAPGDFIEVRYPSYCELSITTSTPPYVDSWSWRGVSGYLYRVTAPSEGEYEVFVAITSCGTPTLPSDEDVLDYLDKLVGELAFIDLNLLRAFILYYLTIPSIYVFILFLATGALARVLGGRDRIPVRVA
mgnify:CR=1 FL=1